MRAKTGRSTLPGAVPTVVQLEEELKRETYRKQYGRVLRSTISHHCRGGGCSNRHPLAPGAANLWHVHDAYLERR